MPGNNFLLDFIGFTYKGYHSLRDLNIYRISDGSRYNNNFAPTITDKTLENPGNDGTYFFGSYHKLKQFNINIAFDSLTEKQFRTLRQVFNGKEPGELIFDELPFKAYLAKITGNPQLKALCFDESDALGNIKRIYKGEGTLQFTCYLPYAYTPDWVWDWENPLVKDKVIQKKADGRVLSNYNKEIYKNKSEWAQGFGLFEKAPTVLVNNGDIAAPFKVELPNMTAGTLLQVANNEITVLEDCANFIWDSRTGMVSGEVYVSSTSYERYRRPIQYSGLSCGTIPENGIEQIAQKTIEGATSSIFENIIYQLWYY